MVHWPEVIVTYDGKPQRYHLAQMCLVKPMSGNVFATKLIGNMTGKMNVDVIMLYRWQVWYAGICSIKES